MDLPVIDIVSMEKITDQVARVQHTLGLVLQEAVDLGHGTVECHDSEAVVRSVQDQVLAHDSQADEAEVTTAAHNLVSIVTVINPEVEDC